MTVEFNSDPNRAYDYADGHSARLPVRHGLEHCESFEEDPCESDPDNGPIEQSEVERLRVEVDYYKPIAQEYLKRAPEIGRRLIEERRQTVGEGCNDEHHTDDELVSIKSRHATATTVDGLARCCSDVPRLVAEVQRLRDQLAAAVDVISTREDGPSEWKPGFRHRVSASTGGPWRCVDCRQEFETCPSDGLECPGPNVISESTQQVLVEVASERQRQVDKWGGREGDGVENPSTSNYVRLRVLVEEVGEVAEAMGRPEDGNGTRDLRTELVQVAAVAVAWLESWEPSNGTK